MNSLAIILALILGYVIGRGENYLRQQLKGLIVLSKKPPKETGPTLGSYRKADEVAYQAVKTTKTGPVEKKTPQRIEWEATEKARKEGIGETLIPR